MNYKDFNDYELLDQIYSCSEDANEILLYKYRPLVVSLAQKFIKLASIGIDLNDYVQEGLLGLNDAINTFRDEKDANFGTYAKLCIERRMISLAKDTMSNKNKILNNYVPLDNEDDEPLDYILADSSKDPCSLIEITENENKIIDKCLAVLSSTEKEVFLLKIQGFSIKEIASIAEKDAKSVDNTIQRIKNKIKDVI